MPATRAYNAEIVMFVAQSFSIDSCLLLPFEARILTRKSNHGEVTFT